MNNSEVSLLQRAVLKWYQRHGRHHLPWRNLESLGIAVPYGVLVSEFMLQQTQVARVVPKFRAFVQTFPTVQKLAAAPRAKVTVLWSGLGYNRRAVMLHACAEEIVSQYNGAIPPDLISLEHLPGIGAYTAAAILAFGYNLPVVVMDTNIERFYELLFFGYTKPTRKTLLATAEDYVPSTQSRAWHSALMDIMADIRTISSPKQQQARLLEVLDITPTWPLPILRDAPLVRPKQSKFLHSKRFYRGRILAYLREHPSHEAPYRDIKQLMAGLHLPAEYSLAEILHGLHKDRLVHFHGPLRGNTRISL